MTIKKFVVPVVLGTLVLMPARSQVQQTLTPEAEAKARRLMRDRMFEQYHKEWRATLQPVEADRAMVYPSTLTPEGEALARRLLAERMGELYAQQSAPAAPMLASGDGQAVSATLTPEREARARQMLREKMADLYAMDAAPKARMASSNVRPNSEALYAMPATPQPTVEVAQTPLGRLNNLYITGQIEPHTYYTELARLQPQR